MTQVLAARAPTGIPGLDEEIGGGLPVGTVTLVYGPPKSGKTTLVAQVVKEAVRRGETGVLMLADYGFEELAQFLQALGCPVHDAKALSVIDMFSTDSNRARPECTRMFTVSPQVPTDIMVALGQAFCAVAREPRRFSVFWDSLTPLFIYNPPRLVAQVVRESSSRIKEAGALMGILTHHEGSVDPQSETILKSSVDNIIHLSDGVLTVEGMIGVRRLHLSYELTEMGLISRC